MIRVAGRGFKVGLGGWCESPSSIFCKAKRLKNGKRYSQSYFGLGH